LEFDDTAPAALVRPMVKLAARQIRRFFTVHARCRYDWFLKSKNTVFSMSEQRIMSSESNDEQAKSQIAKTRKRFKITVVCFGLVMAVVAYATRVYLGDSRLTAIQTANLTYLAILLPGVLLDPIIFRSKPKNTA
jgi:hypothetical protein